MVDKKGNKQHRMEEEAVLVLLAAEHEAAGDRHLWVELFCTSNDSLTKSSTQSLLEKLVAQLVRAHDHLVDLGDQLLEAIICRLGTQDSLTHACRQALHFGSFISAASFWQLHFGSFILWEQVLHFGSFILASFWLQLTTKCEFQTFWNFKHLDFTTSLSFGFSLQRGC